MASRLVRRYGVYALGTFGLLLVTLVGKVAPYAAARPQTHAEHIRTWLAQRALDAIGAIGWLVDHLPPVNGTDRRKGRLQAALVGPAKAAPYDPTT